MKISVYDATLRDGAQGEGISFSERGKLHFIRMMDEFGVDWIEAGFPGSNPRDQHLFSEIRKAPLSRAKLVAFGSTRRVNLDAEEDPQLQALLRTECGHLTLFGESSRHQVRTVLGTTPEQNLQMIADSIGFLREQGREVIFDAEHFFDGFREDSGYAMTVVETAIREGAEYVVLCDTNGASLPHEVFAAMQTVHTRFPLIRLGIHTHNDSGMAAANSIEAVRAGATMVQGCINGYGERTGNADLTTLLPVLEFKLGHTCLPKGNLVKLCEVSRITDDLANLRSNPRQPFVGRSAFSHKAGTHVNAVCKEADTFEQIAPEWVGNSRHILVSELAGISNVLVKSRELGIDLAGKDPQELHQILEQIKEKETQGYSYESADGSLKILLQKVLKEHSSQFCLDGFRVIIEKRGKDAPCISEATIKAKVNGENVLTAGEGSGPVDALNEALRKALTRFYPEIDRMMLTDYRVRILNPEEAAKALTRVLIESGDGDRQWGTVGVSENIIEASWQALLDSVEYQLFSKGDS